jgi:hypothetical protein
MSLSLNAEYDIATTIADIREAADRDEHLNSAWVAKALDKLAEAMRKEGLSFRSDVLLELASLFAEEDWPYFGPKDLPG